MTIAGVVLICSATAVAYLGTVRVALNYRRDRGRLRIVLFCVATVYEIPAADIVSMRKLAPWRLIGTPWALRYSNRIWGTQLLIVKRRGVFRYVVISPDDPDVFLAWFEAKKSGPIDEILP